MKQGKYQKSAKYPDLGQAYAQASGPGGLKLAEFMADKMGLAAGGRLLDAGCNRGWQTCFLAKEYGVCAVGMDPWDDRVSGRLMAEHLAENARLWGVENQVLALGLGLPESHLAEASFDYVYSTTALEMVRMGQGEEGYQACLGEILRLLRPGGVFGLGEPMHLEVELPSDLAPWVSQEPYPWKECFTTISATASAVERAGFRVEGAGYAPDAALWWREYAAHDPFCQAKPEEDPKAIAVDAGRWLSFGWVIARKG